MALSPASSRGAAAFNGGTITTPLVIAPTDATADVLTLRLPAGASGHSNNWIVARQLDEVGNTLDIDGFGDIDLATNSTDRGIIRLRNTDNSKRQILDPNGASGPALKATQLSGALPTIALVSGTGAQVDTAADRQLTVPITYNPGVATIATCTVALSPDDVTYSTLAVITRPVGTVFDGSIDPVNVLVPKNWYVKLTVVNATIGTGTYY